MPTTYTPAVTSSFVAACAAATSDGAGGIVYLGVTYRAAVTWAGEWTFTTSGTLTMTDAVRAEVAAGAALGDGSYRNAAGAILVLVATEAGACEPTDPPGPPPP